MSVVLGFDVNQEFNKIKRSAIKAIEDVFPIEGQKHTIVVDRAWIDDNLDFYDHREQKKVRLAQGTWAVPIYASLRLVDKETGKDIDKVDKFKLFNLPKLTSRYSYIIDGNEYQTINQLRLKSGVYSRIKANEELESQFNLARGVNFKIILNQETECFYINLGTSNIRLLPILLDLGLTPSEIQSAWGDKLFASNFKAAQGVMSTEIMKLYNKLLRKDAANREEAIVGVSDYFSGRTELNPDITKRNLGKAYDKVDANLILDASKKILNISKGTEEPDDRDSLVSKEIHSVEDFIYERLDKNKDKIEKTIRRNLDKRDKIREIVSLDTLNDPVKTLFTGTSLAATTEQINPVDMLANKFEVTIMGEGGITNERQVTNRARAVHPTHLGFIDPFQTPESGHVGATLQLTLAAAKDGNKLKTTVNNMRKSGAPIEQITPEESFDAHVAFPDEYEVRGGKLTPINPKSVKCMYKGELITVPESKIDYVLASTKAMLGMPANLVPFINSDEGARVLMATKMLRQALPLKNREEALVQASTGDPEVTFNKGIGRSFNALSSVDGVVDEVNKDSIIIKDKDGKLVEHQIYDNFPLNQKTFLDETPMVTVGQEVKKGDVLTDSNYTRNGNLALGVNLRAAYIPLKGYSFEDSIVISETAAQKLTSEHIHHYSQRVDSDTIMNLKKFNAYYPGEILPGAAGKLDDDGVIKKGASVEKGDVLIAALVRSEINPEDEILSRISKSLVKPYKNKSQTWDYDFKGTITDVVKGSKVIDVYVRTEEPAVIGDKLSGIHGNKGTIGLILPDSEMPKTKDGKVLEIALNPHGIPSRKNPGQILETFASRIAEKEGKPYIVDNFEDKDYYDKVKKEAKKAGVKETEILVDPKTEQELGEALVGRPYILKLNHPTRKKFSARSYGEGYTAEMQPARGGSKGAQSMDALTVNSLLSHGARNILRETHSIKSEKNDEYWRALQLGMPLPPPQDSFIYNKFMNYLTATGVDVSKNGTKIQLMPLTNDQIEDMANGEVENISIVRGKNLKEEKGGLFDPKIFGGISGSKWGKITLAEPVPNPLFENAIKAVTGLKAPEYEGIVNGNVFIDKDGNITDKKEGLTGGKAIKLLLEKIDLDNEVTTLKNRTKEAKKTELDNINKKLRYLVALQRMERKPTDYVLEKIPVVPPKYRPIYTLPDGNPIVSDLNELYKGVKAVSDQLETGELPEYDKGNLRKDMYKSVKALFGLGSSLTKPDLKGTILELAGDNPKFGLIQQRMIKRRNDLTGRSVISPDPMMGVDEVGIPEAMAWSIYKPFVVRRMVNSGYSPLEAQQRIEERHPVAIEALNMEAANRPVMLNRAPSLHKFSIMAFKPRIIQGKAIKMPILPMKGFNADSDGDTMSVHVPVTEEGREEALKMLPSNHLLNPGSGKLMLVPSMESVLGLHLLTLDGDKKKNKYKDIIDAREAIRNGEIKVTDQVDIGGIKTSVGRYLFNEILPEPLRDYNRHIEKKALVEILEKVKDQYSSDYGRIADGLKHLGNQHSYYSGFNVQFKDLEPLAGERDKILKKAIKAIEAFKKTNPLKKNLDKKVVEEYTKATDEMKKVMMEKLKDKDNAFYHMVASGARGGTNDAMQLVMAPMLLVDAESKVIPIPVTKSYAEGLSTSDMWTQSFAARKGVIDRSRETADPGELSKMLASSMMSHVVTVLDCGTKQGIKLKVTDKNILDRYSAESVPGVVGIGELVSAEVVGKAQKNKVDEIKVRSPLKCEAREGVCVKCSGLDINGKEYEIGDHVGVQSAQTISEPATQLIMKCSRGLISTLDGIFPMSIFFDKSAGVELDGEYENALPVCNVIDKSGEVETAIIQRHEPQDDMYLITTRSGACLLAQGNHPMWTHDGQLRAGFSNRFNKIIGENKYRCTKTTPRDFTYECNKEEIVKLVRDLSREDAIWVDYRTLMADGTTIPNVNPYVAGYFAAEGCFRVGNGTDKYEGQKVATIFSCSDKTEWFTNSKIGKLLGVEHSTGQQAYTVYGSEFADNISSVVGYSSISHRAHNKVLKIDLASLDKKWAQEFLEGYIDGDGCVFESNNTTVARTTSTSFELTCQIVAICHKLGLHCSVGTADGSPSRAGLRTAFDTSIRFPKGYAPINSIKLKEIKPMQHVFGAVCGYDPITKVKKLRNWHGLVYDIKTKSEGFMAGFIRNHNTFHTGGTVQSGAGGIVGAFDRLKQVLTMPEELPDKATLSSIDGEVKSIETSPIGGYDVYINNTKHHTRAGYDLKVKKGDKVKAGDVLSAGVVKPQELLQYKGLDAVQDYMTNQLYDLYKADGPVNRRIMEQIIKAITSLTRVVHPGKTEYIGGDIAPINKINAINKGLDKNDQIIHQPIIKGINMLPSAMTTAEDADWMGRLGYRYIKKTLQEGAAQGWSSDLHGYHPVPALMYAKEFGKGEKGKF